MVTAEQGFPTGAHEPVLWNCKGRQEKQRYCHRLHRGLEPPWGKHSKDEHICAGLAGAKSSWFLSFLPLHRWKAVLPPYLWVQEPGLQVYWPKNQLFCLLILESFPSSGREHHSHLPQHRTGREHLKHPCNSQNHHREKFRQRLYISHMKQQTLQHWMHKMLISPIPTSFKIIPGFCNHQNWHSTTVCQWIESSVLTHHKVIPCRQRKCEQSKSIWASTGERWSIWQ